MVTYARKYDVSENLNHYRLDRIRYKMRDNISTRNGHIWLDARKFSCAKISSFTVMEKLPSWGTTSYKVLVHKICLSPGFSTYQYGDYSAL